MCTALSLVTREHYFGRTLDLDRSYGEEICVIPRGYKKNFLHIAPIERSLAVIGMATFAGDMPLLYDGANEAGLCMAALNFPDNAHYFGVTEGKVNIASFELLPWILSQCKTVAEARVMLEKANITDDAVHPSLPPQPLHWMISDKTESLVVEQTADGLHIHSNLAGVLTNNPPLEQQLFNLNNYRGLRTDNGENTFSNKLSLKEYCAGLGGVGLPGDLSSMSRFVRASFGRANSVCEGDERTSVNQVFHLMADVSMTRGLCRAQSGDWDITVYTACIAAEQGKYYYNNYDDLNIHCVSMADCEPDGADIRRFPIK